MGRTKKRKKHTIRNMAVFLLVVFVSGLAFNVVRPLPAATATPAPLVSKIGAANLAWPSAGSAAIGAQGYGVLEHHGSPYPRPMASIAKLITALALLEKKPFKLGEQGETYMPNAKDVELFDSYLAQNGSVVKVEAGQPITEYQMLQAMLLPSANNIADSAAIWAFGSLENYVAYANTMVKRLGLKQTTVADDASGMSPKTVGTIKDMVLLGELAMANPLIANIVGQKSATLPVAGIIHSANARLGLNNIVGIKTGLTDQAGGCFLFAAEHRLATGERIVIIGVIVGAPTLLAALNQSEPLINSAKPYFGIEKPVKAGDKFATLETSWGEKSDVIAESDVSLVAWKGAVLKPRLDMKPLSHAASPGENVGKLTMLSGTHGESTNLILKDQIIAPSWKWRLTRLFD